MYFSRYTTFWCAEKPQSTRKTLLVYTILPNANQSTSYIPFRTYCNVIVSTFISITLPTTSSEKESKEGKKTETKQNNDLSFKQNHILHPPTPQRWISDENILTTFQACYHFPYTYILQHTMYTYTYTYVKSILMYTPPTSNPGPSWKTHPLFLIHIYSIVLLQSIVIRAQVQLKQTIR